MTEFTIDGIYERLSQAQSVFQEDKDSKCKNNGENCEGCKHVVPCELINQTMIAVEEMESDD